MTDWTSGYVADIDYTFGYYPELNPLRVQLAFLFQGLAYPEFSNACELGFGQGLGINLHAASSTTKWFGTDFNPAQAGFARELAAKAGASAELSDQAFEEFARRADLPDFDYIGLHGIWSWISDQNRRVIVDFIRRKLKVGGVLYISYNTLPGWAAFSPMRYLMNKHAEVMGAEGQGTLNRIQGALEFTEKFLATNPLFARANPKIGERIAQLKEQNSHYLAHEFFNRDWLPMHFSTLAEWLKPAKLQYACSAHYLDLIEVLNLSPEQEAFLNDIPDAVFRQTVRDFMVNQQFRRDYWVKGARRLSKPDQAEQLRRQRLVLTAPRMEVKMKVQGALGEISLNEAIYTPILDLLADHTVWSLARMEKALDGRGITFAQLIQAAMILTGAGYVHPAQDEGNILLAKPHTDAINLELLSKARGNADILCLASPVTGGGIPVGRFQKLFLLALAQGKTQPADWADLVWEILAGQQERLVKEGRTLETAEENIAELTALAESFKETTLPIMQALQIA